MPLKFSARSADFCSASEAFAERWAGAKQRRETRQAFQAEQTWAKEHIKAIRRDTPAFAVLHGVDPEADDPPPYINVRGRMVYHS